MAGSIGRAPEEEALRRWEVWLRKAFPRACVLRPDLSSDIGNGEIVWQVEVRDGKHGRIHVTDDALHLDPEGFDEMTRELEAGDWYGMVDRFVRVQIRSDGEVDALNPLG